MIEDNTRRREDPAPKNQRLTAIRSGGIQHKTCSFDFCCSPTRDPFFQRQHAENGTERPPLLGPNKGRRLEAKRGRPGPPHRQPAKWKRLSWDRRMRDASRRETGRLRRGARPLGSQKATQIARKWETPNQAGPPIRDLLREVFPTLAGQWAVGAGDPPQHTLGRFGREAVDLPVAVVNRSPESACRFAVGVEDSCPHWVPHGRKNERQGVNWGKKPAQKCAKRTLARTETALPSRSRIGGWPWNPRQRKLLSTNPSGPHRKAPLLPSSHSAIVFREATVGSLSPASVSGGPGPGMEKRPSRTQSRSRASSTRWV